MASDPDRITVGVLALQGAFLEHLSLLRQATSLPPLSDMRNLHWTFIEVRTVSELEICDGLIIPGGESTTMALVAARSNMLDPLRDFVKVRRKPVWGTCAGLILLAESANKTKRGGQDLIGGLDVRVNRNHYGAQVESFVADLTLPFLRQTHDKDTGMASPPFKAIFIRAPVVEEILPTRMGPQVEEEQREATIIAPSRVPEDDVAKKAIGGEVQVMATLPGRTTHLPAKVASTQDDHGPRDIVAVRQGTVFGTSFHPELTGDPRIHAWWLQELLSITNRRRQSSRRIDS